MLPAGCIEIGKIIGVHGLKGEIKVYSYAESMEHYAPRRRLMLMDEAGRCRSFEISGAQAQKNICRIALAGVTSRDQADNLVGCVVLIERSELPPLEKGVYYWADLLGMEVFSGQEDYLGRVTEIIPTGANDVYVVQTHTAAGKREILIPALASVVIEIDIDGRRMRVDLPEGLE